MRGEVARLTQQLEQWRASGGPPSASVAALPQPPADDPEQARREAERGQWRAELERLRRALEDVTQRSHSLALDASASSASASTSTGAGGGRRFGNDQLLEQLAAERLATAAARERAAALRREAAEERRAFAQRQASEELAHIEKHMQAERDLRLAQQAELDDVDRTAEELRGQLVVAQSANAELRTALAQQRSLLQRLSG